jgi:nucleotide-binding universal stress UspA family protein
VTPVRDLAAVVVPVDLDDPDANAVHVAIAFARGPDRVHVASVVAPRDLSAMSPDPQVHATALRARLREWLSSEGFPLDLRTHVTTALSPATAICDVAVATRAELVVIASHGRKGLPRLVLGSVTEQVLRNAPCPVLVLRHAG